MLKGLGGDGLQLVLQTMGPVKASQTALVNRLFARTLRRPELWHHWLQRDGYRLREGETARERVIEEYTAHGLCAGKRLASRSILHLDLSNVFHFRGDEYFFHITGPGGGKHWVRRNVESASRISIYRNVNDSICVWHNGHEERVYASNGRHWPLEFPEGVDPPRVQIPNVSDVAVIDGKLILKRNDHLEIRSRDAANQIVRLSTFCIVPGDYAEVGFARCGIRPIKRRGETYLMILLGRRQVIYWNGKAGDACQWFDWRHNVNSVWQNLVIDGRFHLLVTRAVPGRGRGAGINRIQLIDIERNQVCWDGGKARLCDTAIVGRGPYRKIVGVTDRGAVYSWGIHDGHRTEIISKEHHGDRRFGGPPVGHARCLQETPNGLIFSRPGNIVRIWADQRPDPPTLDGQRQRQNDAAVLTILAIVMAAGTLLCSATRAKLITGMTSSAIVARFAQARNRQAEIHSSSDFKP